MNAESRALPRLAGTGLLLLLSVGVLHAQTFQVIHSFTGGADGLEPESGLTMDAAGNLYGTAYYGGNTGTNCDGSCGTVFKMKHSGEGWILTPLYAFNGGSDGSHPTANVTLGPDGSLYGTTINGGVSCPSSTQRAVAPSSTCGRGLPSATASSAPGRKRFSIALPEARTTAHSRSECHFRPLRQPLRNDLRGRQLHQQLLLRR